MRIIAVTSAVTWRLFRAYGELVAGRVGLGNRVPLCRDSADHGGDRSRCGLCCTFVVVLQVNLLATRIVAIPQGLWRFIYVALLCEVFWRGLFGVFI